MSDERNGSTSKKDGTNIFSGKKVDKIVFNPLDPAMAERIKKVSEPAPRPMPEKIDSKKQNYSEWTPKVDDKVSVGKKLVEGAEKVGSVLKYLVIGTLALGSIVGIGLLIKWVMEQYNLL